MPAVKLKKTVTVEVNSDAIISITATTASGAVIPVTGPISVGDYNITDTNGASSILSAADYAAELVPAA